MDRRFFANVPVDDWNDWHWQFKADSNAEQLEKYIQLTKQEKDSINSCLRKYRMAITPYYLSLINPDDPFDPIAFRRCQMKKNCILLLKIRGIRCTRKVILRVPA